MVFVQKIDEDLEEPRLAVCAFLKKMKGTPGRQERLLYSILCGMMIAQHAPGDTQK